jgi:hypothetical protein
MMQGLEFKAIEQLQAGKEGQDISEQTRRALQEGKIPDPREGQMPDKHQDEISRALVPEDYQQELEGTLSDPSEDWTKKLLPDEGDSVKDLQQDLARDELSVRDASKKVAEQDKTLPEVQEQAKDTSNFRDVPEKMTAEELKETGDAYNDEVREKSAAGEVKFTDVSEWKEISDEECESKRADFNRNKDAIRADWEKRNGQEWPMYGDNEYNDKGKLFPKGEKYDAHHIQPLKYGGENTVENITPIHKDEHTGSLTGIHRAGSPYSKLKHHVKVS